MTDASLSLNFPLTPTADWHDRLRRDLGDDFMETLTWQPLEGIDLRAFYRAADLEALPHVTRGVQGTKMRPVGSDAAANDWTIAQRLPLHAPSFIDRLHAALNGGAERIVASAVQGDAQAVLAPALRRGYAEAAAQNVQVHLDGGTDALAVLNHLGVDDSSPLAYIDPHMLKAFRHWSPGAEQAWRAHPHLHPPAHPIIVDARLPHTTGLPMADELALALGSWSQALATQGADAFSAGLPHRVLVAVDTSYFLEIAKLRALRLLFPQVAQAYADLHDTAVPLAPADVTLYAETSPRSHTLFDPHANLLRAATQSAAAVIGGANQLAVHPFRRDAHDEAANADRLARNTQLILKHEAHLHRVADPAAGAYYLEQATHRLAEAAWSRFQEIEAAGGLLDWAGRHLQTRVRVAREERRMRIANRTDVLVGTNHYPDPDPDTPVTPQETPSESPAQQHFDHQPPAWTQPLSLSEGYDVLRLRIQQLDAPPTALIAPVGTPSMRSARATFARNIVGCLGLRLIEPLGYDSIDAAIDAVHEHEPDVVVWCADDDTLADLLDRAPTDTLDALTIAAAPPKAVPDAQTVDLLLHRGAPTLQRLRQLADALGA